MTYRQLKKQLMAAGFRFYNASGHEWWINDKTGVRIRLPHTHKNEVPTGTANAILKQAGLK